MRKVYIEKVVFEVTSSYKNLVESVCSEITKSLNI